MYFVDNLNTIHVFALIKIKRSDIMGQFNQTWSVELCYDMSLEQNHIYYKMMIGKVEYSHIYDMIF